MTTCFSCRNWRLKDSPLASVGFGTCAAQQDPIRRAGQTFSPENRCRIGKFSPASQAQLRLRAAAGKAPT